ncbi:MAG: reverse transcriptase domain-containing protein, partial [Myxococcota bacterium]
MNLTFSDMLNRNVLIYLDDILVFSATEDEHLQHLCQVFKRLREKKFFAKRNKCKFVETSCKYLGHLVEGGKVSVDPEKTEPIRT